MTIEFTQIASSNALPIYCVSAQTIDTDLDDQRAKSWVAANNFNAKPGSILLLPDESGALAGAIVALGAKDDFYGEMILGSLSKKLPAGKWRFVNLPSSQDGCEVALLGLKLGAYQFTKYSKASECDLCFEVPADCDQNRIELLTDATFLARDLINTPANDMGPQGIEDAAQALAKRHDASCMVIRGDDLLTQNFPMIHAVGRAADQVPRLIDIKWGKEDAPKVTLVGKGVSFDTGGLDIKPPSSMRNMKKDMGGAANVLALATMIMGAKLPVRLRVLIPAVENSISANAFRPGDILASRKGISVEIGNTDAEGRLVLGDALTLGDEEAPQMMIDVATLTGAARVALGPDLPPFYTQNDELAQKITQAANDVIDPLWRLPLWQPYAKNLNSKVADTNNITGDGFAGSLTAALFLQKFVEHSQDWVHLDILGWRPSAMPHCPVGGDAQGMRALFAMIENHYK